VNPITAAAQSAFAAAIVGLGLLLTYWQCQAGARFTGLARAVPVQRSGAVSEQLEVPVLMELISAALGAGSAVPRGLQATGDAIGGSDGLSLCQVGAALRLGADWSEAWQDAPARLQVIGRALRPAWEDGASPREALRLASDDVRRERRDAVRTAAAQLAVRLVLPLGLCLLPAFILLGLMPVLISLGVDLMQTL